MPRDHRGLDNAWANCVDASATRGIFESSALREPEDSVLSGVVGSTPGSAHQPSQRRPVEDCAVSLVAHLMDLELHATPYTTEHDDHHSVQIFSLRVGRVPYNLFTSNSDLV